MAGRRGEGQFVALELNLIRDSKLGGVARALRISKVTAIGHLALWREFVLTKGDGATGTVRGYTQDEIAEFLDWRGRADRLVAALKAGDFLATKRSGFTYPAEVR